MEGEKEVRGWLIGLSESERWDAEDFSALSDGAGLFSLCALWFLLFLAKGVCADLEVFNKLHLLSCMLEEEGGLWMGGEGLLDSKADGAFGEERGLDVIMK